VIAAAGLEGTNPVLAEPVLTVIEAAADRATLTIDNDGAAQLQFGENEMDQEKFTVPSASRFVPRGGGEPLLRPPGPTSWWYVMLPFEHG
jgi:hypothetical protein